MIVGPIPLSRAILVEQARRYPLWEAPDLYKLLHQATLGSEHAAPDAAKARRRLEEEMAGMGPGPAEPLLDPIRADGALARVHLRPWREAGLDPAILRDAFLETAITWGGSVGELEEAWRRAGEQAEEWGLRAEAVAALAADLKAAGFPAVSHSAAYRLHYRPAYRVVAPRLLPADLQAGLPGSA